MAPELKIGKTTSITEFLGKLFQVRDQIHLSHLSSKSFSEHVALGDFYSELIDLVDTLVESIQGKYGIQTIVIPSSSKVEPIVSLKTLAKLTDGGELYNKVNESWIKNQLDEISQLTYQTIYKLENLK